MKCHLQFPPAGMCSLHLSLSRRSEYEVFVDGTSAGKMSTNLSGKLSVSVELSDGQNVPVKSGKVLMREKVPAASADGKTGENRSECIMICNRADVSSTLF